MKTKLTLFVLLFCFINLWGQERYFVNATNGLNVRESPSVNAPKVGKRPYGALINVVETTNIKYEVTEDGETFQSQWVKIKYNNFPYVNGTEHSYQWDNQGYVVKYYLEKLSKKKIVKHTIDSTTFYSLYKESVPYDPTKITSFKEVKKMLYSRVKWSASPLFENTGVIDAIYLPNGQTLDADEEAIDFVFRAYYPSEEILLFEGGHSSDFSISIQTGETLKTVGNPEYIVRSPSSKFRLNGWFPGQECSSYFFQEKTGDGYTYLTEFDDNVCYFNKFCWLTDGEFVYSYMDYSKSDGEEKYVRASIVKATE